MTGLSFLSNNATVRSRWTGVEGREKKESWRLEVSIPLPYTCEAYALPIELSPRREREREIFFFWMRRHPFETSRFSVDMLMFMIAHGSCSTLDRRLHSHAVVQYA